MFKEGRLVTSRKKKLESDRFEMKKNGGHNYQL